MSRHPRRGGSSHEGLAGGGRGASRQSHSEFFSGEEQGSWVCMYIVRPLLMVVAPTSGNAPSQGLPFGQQDAGI